MNNRQAKRGKSAIYFNRLRATLAPMRPPKSPGKPNLPPLRSARLLDQLRKRIRYLHYSLRTEEAYVQWTRRFIHFHGLRYPHELRGTEVEAFLSDLANVRNVSASTHKQGLSALLFLYRDVLGMELPWMNAIGRPATRIRLSVVLSREETARLLAVMSGPYATVVQLQYGCGLRLLECLRLRVKDLDFARQVIVVHEGKGGKDRVVMLPHRLLQPLRAQLAVSRKLWSDDRLHQRPGVWMPDALDRKLPRAGESWAWHWVWPSPVLSEDPRSSIRQRHHLH